MASNTQKHRFLARYYGSLNNSPQVPLAPVKLITLASLITLLTAAGCRSTDDEQTSELRVISGIAIDDSRYPAVVRVSSPTGPSCTGTFVSKTTVLTAAHCIPENKQGVSVYLNESWVAADKVFIHPDFIDPDRHESIGTTAHRRRWMRHIDKDFAALIFNQEKSESYNKIGSTQGMQIRQDLVTLVGYGLRTFNYGGDSKKRMGVNYISQRLRNRAFVLREFESRVLQANPGHHAIGSQGDSGGPMLCKDAIIAITSWAELNLEPRFGRTLTTYYANLESDEAKRFIALATDEGAKFHFTASD